jgi:hypothetical protein
MDNVVMLRLIEPQTPEALRERAERTAQKLVSELVEAFGQRGAAVYLQLLTNNVARIPG